MATTRREFIKTAGIAAASIKTLKPKPVFAQATIKTVQTDILEIAYEEHGPSDGFPIILVHGFPYDIRSFDGVPAPLIDAGYRVLVPYVRGYGQTRFLDADAPRMAEQAAIAQDLVDFADALGIDQFAASGFDWGNRAICITSILHPQRVVAQVACGGYSVQDTINPGGPAPARFESLLWYQWYFNTERGIRGLTENRHDIVRHLWDTWSPGWTYSDEDYARSAASFDNPDFVDIVIHSYRHCHVNAPGEDRFLEVEQRLAERPVITVPAIVLRADESGFGPPSADPTADQARFSNLRGRRIVAGAGHDLPAHRPDTVADALLELLA
ncbi:MAG: alpha/beta fold hydrolase [Pseudomonadales bacterium]|nr:alpha/beta fold hydrolase [Pseudomonadales bacterium]